MVWQILLHTPVWVWFLLAYVLFRATKALHERPLNVGMLVAMPGVFLLLGLSGLVTRIQTEPWLGLTWVVALALGIGLGQATVSQASVFGSREAPRIAGSVLPLILMIVFFTIRYSLGVLGAIHPEMLAGFSAGLATSALYGALSGLMLGRTLRTIVLARRLPPSGAIVTGAVSDIVPAG